MNKKLSLLLCGALILSIFSGCSKPATSNSAAPSSNASTASVKDDNSIQERTQSPEWAAKLGDSKKVNQMIVVCGIDKQTAYISMHEKNSKGDWEQLFSTPGFIGKDGLGETSEDICHTPVGTFELDTPFGIGDDPGCALGYTKVTEDLYWSGDQRDGFKYNQLVNIKDLPDLDKSVSEHLIEVDPHYYYGINISCNKDCIKGKGSAFFIHCFSDMKPYTGGCVAMPRYCMKTLLTNVKSDCVVVLDTIQNIAPEEWQRWKEDEE